MPLFFVGYALAVWFCAAKWRRGPIAFLAILVGLSGLMLLNWFHAWIAAESDGRIKLVALQGLMYPYTGFVAFVGLYIACLPKRRPHACHHCGYDLSSLIGELSELRCPECGKMHRENGRGVRPSGMDRPSLKRDAFQPK